MLQAKRLQLHNNAFLKPRPRGELLSNALHQSTHEECAKLDKNCLDVTHRPKMTALRNSHFKHCADKAMTTENAANYLRNNRQITRSRVSFYLQDNQTNKQVDNAASDNFTYVRKRCHQKRKLPPTMNRTSCVDRNSYSHQLNNHFT